MAKATVKEKKPEKLAKAITDLGIKSVDEKVLVRLMTEGYKLRKEAKAAETAWDNHKEGIKAVLAKLELEEYEHILKDGRALKVYFEKAVKTIVNVLKVAKLLKSDKAKFFSLVKITQKDAKEILGNSVLNSVLEEQTDASGNQVVQKTFTLEMQGDK